MPGEAKRYVQETIKENHAEVWRLLEAGANVYVCGEANRMAPAVRSAFMEVFRQETNASDAAAQAWLDGMIQSQAVLATSGAGKVFSRFLRDPAANACLL